MTRETYDKASELFSKIDDLENAIDAIENDKEVRQCKVLNWYFDYDDDKEAFKKNALSFLRARLSNYRKQVNKL